MDEPKEYIERGAAVDELRRRTKMAGELIAMECDSDLLKKVLNIYYIAREEAAKLIEEIPAADVVEVVRCGNCKHWASHRAAKYGRCMCVEEIAEGQWHTQADDFCSHGERKEE